MDEIFHKIEVYYFTDFIIKIMIYTLLISNHKYAILKNSFK